MMKKIKTTINHHKKRLKKLLAEGIITSMVALSTLNPFANLNAKDIDYDKLPTIKKETLLNYQEQLLNNKIDGIRYYSPKQMKEVKGYFKIETNLGDNPFVVPMGKYLDGIIPHKKNKIKILRKSKYSITYLEENYDVYNIGMDAIKKTLFTKLFPLPLKYDSNVIAPKAFETKEWFVIPVIMEEGEIPALQIINKNQFKKMMYETAKNSLRYMILRDYDSKTYLEYQKICPLD